MNKDRSIDVDMDKKSVGENARENNNIDLMDDDEDGMKNDDEEEEVTGPKPMLPYNSMFIFSTTNP